MKKQKSRFPNVTYAILLLFVGSIFQSCHPIFCSWELGYSTITESLSNEDVTGIYRLSDQSLEYILKQGFPEKNYSITLLENGYYFADNLPDFIISKWGETANKVTTKTNQWGLTCQNLDYCMIELQEIIVTELRQKDGKWAICIPIGDPDGCLGIVYEGNNFKPTPS